MSIDESMYARLVNPQDDQSDTKVFVELADYQPTHQSMEDCTLFQKRNQITANDMRNPQFFDGQVLIGHYFRSFSSPNWINAPVDHPHLVQASQLLQVWPAVYQQFKSLTVLFHPILNEEDDRDISGSAGEFGIIYGSVTHHPALLAAAFVHEMAHHKLMLLGVGFEKSCQLIINNPGDLFESPLIRWRKRPMQAVVHAVYSILHMTAFYSFLAEKGSAKDRAPGLRGLGTHIPQLQHGVNTISNHVKTDKIGQLFITEMLGWAKSCIENGTALLNQHGGKKKAMPVLTAG